MVLKNDFKFLENRLLNISHIYRNLNNAAMDVEISLVPNSQMVQKNKTKTRIWKNYLLLLMRKEFNSQHPAFTLEGSQLLQLQLQEMDTIWLCLFAQIYTQTLLLLDYIHLLWPARHPPQPYINFYMLRPSEDFYPRPL